jgi:hypothetical protein
MEIRWIRVPSKCTSKVGHIHNAWWAVYSSV